MSTHITGAVMSHASNHAIGSTDELTLLGDDTITPIYAGAGTTSWADLNISALIGSRKCLLLVSAHNATTDVYVGFRTNGDTREYKPTALYNGSVSGGIHTHGSYNTFLVLTDTNGIFEMRCSSTASMTLDLMWFIPVGA